MSETAVLIRLDDTDQTLAARTDDVRGFLELAPDHPAAAEIHDLFGLP